MSMGSNWDQERLSRQVSIARASLPRLSRLAGELEALTEEIFAKRVSYTHDDAADVMVLSFVTKQAEHLQSVQALNGINAHRDALLIARTMVEGWGRLRWAFNKRPERTDLWLWYGAILDWRQINENLAEGLEVDPEEQAILKMYVDQHGANYLRKRVRDAMSKAADEGVGYKAPDDPWANDWTQVDVRSMFAEIGLEALYDHSYRTASEWVHWGPRAILRAADSTEWGTAGFTETDWPTASLSLLLACVSLHQCLATLEDHFSLGHAGRLRELYANLKRDMDEAIDSAAGE